MKTEHRLYIALGVVVALGGAVYFQSQSAQKKAAAYTLDGKTSELPKVEITEQTTKAIDKIEITNPPSEDKDSGEKKEAVSVVLEKKGNEWRLTKPVDALANQSSVESVLNGLKDLKITETIDPGTTAYEDFDVSDKKAVHATFFKGKDKVGDFYFGKSGGRGQMTRIAGKDGVYAIEGFSRFAYTRDVKGWRDTAIFKFESDKVKMVELSNENGLFTFTREEKKDGDKTTKEWTGKLKKAKEPIAKKIEKLDASKVDDLVRAYQNLNASDFGDDKKPSDVGLETPVATITFVLDDDAKRIVHLGANAEGDARWAKKADGEKIFSVSSYSATWATADAAKFTKEDKKDDKGDEKKDEAPPALPPFPGGDEDE